MPVAGALLICWKVLSPQQVTEPVEVTAQAARYPTDTDVNVPVAGALLICWKALFPQQVTPEITSMEVTQELYEAVDRLVISAALHGEQAVPPSGDVEPAGHVVQVEEPGEGLYVPYKHIYGWSYWQK